MGTWYEGISVLRGHIILHKDIWKDVNTPVEWADAWKKLPDNIHNKLDNNAKGLAGILLPPRYPFINRAVEIRVRVLADNFNVNSQPCEIRMERIERYFKQSLFEMILKYQYLKKLKDKDI